MAKQNPQNHEDFTLKETAPDISRRRVTIGPTTAFDLVEDMNFLYVKVVKARNLSATSSPYVELTIGNYRGTTLQQHQENIVVANPEWNQVFAFNKEIIQDTTVQIFVKHMKATTIPGDDILGRLAFEIAEVPKRTPPDSSLAPQWYRLEDSKGMKIGGELMLSLWMGTQADEAFSDAWHSDAAMVNGEGVFSTRSKVYMSPRLWYLRVNVIEAQDLIILDKNRKPNVFVKAVLGNLVLGSKVSETKSANPMWNEDLMFVAAEPFDEPLVLSVEERVVVPPNKRDECLGRCLIPLKTVKKRDSADPAPNIWYNLERPQVVVEGGEEEKVKFASKLHMRISLDGAYHVLDEPTYYTSDLRPSLKSLWKPNVGVLELGILNASDLLPMKPKENRTDAYCVAKYGQKWVRTRTIANSFAPKWNEQYTWEVFDLCTVITIGIFDNSNIRGPQGGAAMDSRIGKVRIRLSTLEVDRTYTHSYPLVVLQPSGVKKMGEIQLALRFSCSQYLSMLQSYAQPLLPKMHYILPLSVFQLDSLRHQASLITSLRLSLAEPPLRKEIVDYMLDADVHLWSTRRGKANFNRVSRLLDGVVKFMKWFDQIQKWTSPVSTILVYIAFLIFLCYPELILPTLLLYFCLVGAYRYSKRPRNPPHMDTELSHAYTVSPDELDEEFDPFPSRKSGEVLRIRYDRLRSFAGRIQTVLGDIATQGERVESLLSWRDPRATCLFVLFCALASVVIYNIPFRRTAALGGFYVIRPPIWRYKIPSIPQNFLRRMPAKTESML